MDAATLLWGVLFGSIGVGFFMYGKKQQAAIPLISGIVLMIFPYFVSNVALLVIIGVIFTALPFLIKR
ncbi:MAG: hypothetical protein CDV28_10251 [Candidatus Electronema aureum]|jgi:hypothetical protein|uniref:Amino acid transport protein n=1 Tax=Candidatus Electronema aureum TaxID=2005002 RepID=A0A521G4H6_9BACT|nr:MAG: hypothetical protein CDV28_10251 [Candidatus Electronema aureum]